MNGTGNGCTQCSEGSYRPSLAVSTCSSCPPNSSCRGSAFNCLAGFTIDSAGTGCTQCAVNFAKPTVGNDGCSQCPVGTTASAGSSSCFDCPNGSYRPSLSIANCLSCPPYSNCSVSSYSCTPGYTINANGDGCIMCSANYIKQYVGNQACVQCNADTVSSSDRTYCINCPTGKYRAVSEQECTSSASPPSNNLNTESTAFLQNSTLLALAAAAGAVTVVVVFALVCPSNKNKKKQMQGLTTIATYDSNITFSPTSTTSSRTKYGNRTFVDDGSFSFGETTVGNGFKYDLLSRTAMNDPYTVGGNTSTVSSTSRTVNTRSMGPPQRMQPSVRRERNSGNP